MVPIEKLVEKLGAENVIADRLENLCYSRDMSVHRGVPEAIVTPLTTAMVSDLLKLASEFGFAVIPRGAGSSVTGAILPVVPSVICDLSKMNRIKEIRFEDGYAVVEPGVVCADLNAALKPKAFFAPDPGSSSVATIGGMVATNASGLRAVKYGTTKDHVLGLEVVLADGTIIKTGTKAPKASFGYDLTRLMAASEGTLGIITEITVKLTRTPQYSMVLTAVFDKLEDAGRSVSEVLAEGIGLSICEIMDRASIEVINKVSGMGLEECEAMLIIEIDGNRSAVQDDVKRVREICQKNGVRNVSEAHDEKEKAKMWGGRKGLVASLSRVKPGSRLIPIAEDFGVPISAIPEAIKKAQEIAKRNNAILATFGHVGDGNVHTTFIGDVRVREDWEKLRVCAQQLVECILNLGGTMSAEHGIGIAKAPFARKGLGEAIDVMKKIKNALDPKGVLNPHKLGFEEKGYDIFDFFAFEEILKRGAGTYPIGEKAENELLLCVQCGFCRPVCPTFLVTKLESMNARGRNILAYTLCDGTNASGEDIARKFYSCTTCMNCKQVCPSRIDVPQIVHSVREKLWGDGFAPSSIKSVVGSIMEKSNPLGQPKEGRMETYPKEKRKEWKEGKWRSGDILLWLGCMPSYADMKIVSSTMKIMDAAGANYFFLGEDEGCCGYFVYLAGSPDFIRIVKENVERIKSTGAKTIVTPCAGCYRTFKNLYRKETAMEIEVLHIVEFVERMMKEGKLKLGDGQRGKVVYHDPCDLGRHMQVYDSPRVILKEVLGENFLEFARNKENSLCCGGGGGVAAYSSDISLSVSDERVREANKIGAEVIVSACAGCKSNLKKSAARLRKEIQTNISVMDITEIVSSSLKF